MVESPVQGPTQPTAHAIGRQVVERGSFASDPIGRKVVPPQLEAVGLEVLKVIEHLKSRAKLIAERPGSTTFAVKVEEEAADGVCRILAIGNEVAPTGAAPSPRVPPERRKKLTGVLCGLRSPEAGEGEALGGAVRSTIEPGFEPSEASQLLLDRKSRIVGHVIGVACEAVEDGHILSEIAPDQEGAHRKIFAVAHADGSAADVFSW